ncbi:hypothetical protein [Cellulomonas hominis]
MRSAKVRHGDGDGDGDGDGRSGAGGGSRGMRLTARLVSLFGPAQVGDHTAPERVVSADERERDDRLHLDLERVVGADGRSYLVERPTRVEGAAAAGPERVEGAEDPHDAGNDEPRDPSRDERTEEPHDAGTRTV